MTTTYPEPGKGRGAFPKAGTGGTIDAAGTAPGRYYRSPAPSAPKTLLRPGLLAYRAIKAGTVVPINEYAVYAAVKMIQAAFGSEPDGILGPKTDLAVKNWQQSVGLNADGVFGPASCKMLFTPIVSEAAKVIDPDHHEDLAKLVRGHIGYESGWDPGAVGVQDPRDLGLAQIHLPAHPEVSVDEALDGLWAARWMARFVDENLEAMGYNVRDAVAAYNLGKAGARAWIKAGRPDTWTPEGSTAPRSMRKYIDNVLSAA